MPADEATCPKCGNPRFEGSLDCPYCGIVYDRYSGDRPPQREQPAAPASTSPPPEQPPPQPPATSDAPQFDDVYQGPSIEDIRAGADPGVPSPTPQGSPAQQASKLRGVGQAQTTPQETFFSRNVRLSLVIFGALYVLLLGFWSSAMLGGTAEGDSVRTRFFTLAGVGAPKSYEEASYVRFVGRSFLMFMLPGDRSFPTVVVLYHKGALAGRSTPEALVAEVKGTLDSIGLPYRDHERRRGRLGSAEVEVEILAVGEGKRPGGLIGLVPFTATDGRPAVLVLAAPQREYRDLQNAFVDRSFGG